MYSEVLQRCFKQKDLVSAKQVHDCIRKSAMEQNIYVANNLMRVYIRCGRLQDARRVFDKLVKKSVFSWTIMMGGYAQHDHAEDAMEVFNQMRQEGAQPDEITYLSILKACASPVGSKWGKEVHAHIRNGGFESDVRVGTALLKMYAKSGRIDDARQVFDRMVERDVVTWTVMIGGLAEQGFGHEAFSVFLQMQRGGYVPDAITYVSILSACSSPGALDWVKEVHSHVLRAGLESDVRVGNALVHMYAKSGSIDDARLVFDRIVERDVITWNVMIGGLAQQGFGHEAFSLFLQMERGGFVPDAITYVSILSAFASAGAVELVKEVHSHALRAGLESDLRVGTALVDMYAKSGSIDDARLVFDRMVERDVVTWTVMIGGLAQHGCGQEALLLFGQMIAEGVRPNGVTFVATLSACSHVGLVDKGRHQFLAMTQNYGIKPTIEHYTCMVDLLGRAGHLEEAKLFILNMPLEPDGATWGALLGACRTYGNVELAEFAAKERLKLEPKSAATYVLLSNIYAGAGKWGQVSSLRTMMQGKGLHKEPGRSWIEVDNQIHRFVVGDTSHPESKEIHAELNILTEKMKAEGYIPDTRLVLHNIGEEDKELALCSHSEKLAIAYGLMRTAPGNPIHIYKNLRVCSDCHTATKFISKMTGREIVARDANRFHHFKDGVCSCGDYW